MRKLLLVFVLLTAPLCADDRDYVGRYEQTDGNVVIVSLTEDALILRPLFWRSIQTLTPEGPDRFFSAERPERHAVFTRDANGRVVSLAINGIGHDAPMPRLMHTRAVPAELIMSGRPREAARAILKRKDAVDVAIGYGDFIARALPTKVSAGADFIGAIVKKLPRNARLLETYGTLLVAAGRRAEGRQAFERAIELDPKLERAAEGLRMLASSDLTELFAPPTAAEIAKVAEIWSRRDLAPREVEIVHRGTMSLGTAGAEVRIVAHRVHGSLHYGAVIVPRGASEERLAPFPVIVDAKGVSPSYFPLDLARVPASAQMFGGAFIYVLPAYRGEVLMFDGKTWTSEGDRTDAWDGATDDFIAFTSAALTITPEADGERMCAFGRSRGGTVALLAGIRDQRFDCVVSWAGPADQLQEMVQSGWTPRERAAEGVRRKSDVFGIGGQFIETFLAPGHSVADTRLHLIASSPLYFAERLRHAQVHYGEDDNIVSLRNGRALVARNRGIELIVHPEAGHDLDQAIAFRETKRFVLQRLMPR
ncbi:MAG: prolyl oligopeptidase family serine peptidase [Thermoanaerobaculia bacterium]